MQTMSNQTMSNQTMSNQTSIVTKTIEDSFKSKAARDKFLLDPAAALQSNGFSLPQDQKEKFNHYFSEVARNVLTQLRETPEDQLSDSARVMIAGIGCTVCNVAAWGVAAAIVAVGAAALPELTAGSAVVVGLAAFTGFEVATALSFIYGLASVVGSGAGAVAGKICQWTGACD
jgi:hypothetical protein